MTRRFVVGVRRAPSVPRPPYRTRVSDQLWQVRRHPFRACHVMQCNVNENVITSASETAPGTARENVETRTRSDDAAASSARRSARDSARRPARAAPGRSAPKHSHGAGGRRARRGGARRGWRGGRATRRSAVVPSRGERGGGRGGVGERKNEIKRRRQRGRDGATAQRSLRRDEAQRQTRRACIDMSWYSIN